MRLHIAALLTALLTLCGCISTTDSKAMFSTVRSEPMGPDQYMVSCVNKPRYCAEESNKLCPQGLDVVSTTGSATSHDRLTMVIKCHPDSPEKK